MLIVIDVQAVGTTAVLRRVAVANHVAAINNGSAAICRAVAAV